MIKISSKALAVATALTAGLSGGPAMAAETYAIDQGHTEVFFGWSHAGVSRQWGEFTRVEGALTLDAEAPETAQIEVTIDMTSVSSGYAPLDKHLKASDFLGVETFPEAHFISTSVEQTGDTTAKVTGDLTLHGVTKSVTLDTTLTHIGAHPVGKWIDAYKGNWVAFEAKTVLDHQAFGIGAYSTGPIQIEIRTELKGQ